MKEIRTKESPDDTKLFVDFYYIRNSDSRRKELIAQQN